MDGISYGSPLIAIAFCDSRIHILRKHTNIKYPSGGAIGAGLFVGTASAYQTGGPGAVLIGFMIIGEWDPIFMLKKTRTDRLK